jgi:hypothetical protein
MVRPAADHPLTHKKAVSTAFFDGRAAPPRHRSVHVVRQARRRAACLPT